MRSATVLACVLLGQLTGCVLISGQKIISYEFQDPIVVTSPNEITPLQVDLNDQKVYRDHKSDLSRISEIALLGSIEHDGTGEAIVVEVWITPEITDYTLETQVRDHGELVWGPEVVGARKTHRLDWDHSSGLVAGNGRQILERQAKGDGKFTLYFLDQAGPYTFTIRKALLTPVMDAGL